MPAARRSCSGKRARACLKESAFTNAPRRRLATRWQNEKHAIDEVSDYKERIEQARVEVERAQRESDYERASQLLYQEIPELER